MKRFKLTSVKGIGPATWRFSADITAKHGFIFKKERVRSASRIYQEWWIWDDTKEPCEIFVDQLEGLFVNLHGYIGHSRHLIGTEVEGPF